MTCLIGSLGTTFIPESMRPSEATPRSTNLVRIRKSTECLDVGGSDRFTRTRMLSHIAQWVGDCPRPDEGRQLLSQIISRLNALLKAELPLFQDTFHLEKKGSSGRDPTRASRSLANEMDGCLSYPSEVFNYHLILIRTPAVQSHP